MGSLTVYALATHALLLMFCSQRKFAISNEGGMSNYSTSNKEDVRPETLLLVLSNGL